MGSLVGLLLPAGLLSLSLFVHILSCALYNNWWPMIALLLYLLMLIPLAVLMREGESAFEPGSAASKHWSIFVLSTLITLVVGVPIVMYHVDVIESGPVFLSLSGFVLLITTGAAGVLFGGGGEDS